MKFVDDQKTVNGFMKELRLRCNMSSGWQNDLRQYLDALLASATAAQREADALKAIEYGKSQEGKRGYRGGLDNELNQEIETEIRGETIAAQRIAAAIRNGAAPEPRWPLTPEDHAALAKAADEGQKFHEAWHGRDGSQDGWRDDVVLLLQALKGRGPEGGSIAAWDAYDRLRNWASTPESPEAKP